VEPHLLGGFIGFVSHVGQHPAVDAVLACVVPHLQRHYAWLNLITYERQGVMVIRNARRTPLPQPHHPCLVAYCKSPLSTKLGEMREAAALLNSNQVSRRLLPVPMGHSWKWMHDIHAQRGDPTIQPCSSHSCRRPHAPAVHTLWT